MRVDVLEDEQGRIFPAIHNFTHPSPIGAAALGENEDHRTAVKAQVGAARGYGVRSNVAVVGVLQVDEHGLGVLADVLGVFVIHDRRLKTVLRSGLLQQGVTLIFELLARTVPVHHEGVDAKALGFGNLAREHVGIMRGIPDVDVLGLAKPGLVGREQARRSFGALQLSGLREALADVGRVPTASSGDRQRKK